MTSKPDTSLMARQLLWTLRHTELRLQLLASLPDQTLASLFHSWTTEEKKEASGLLAEVSMQLGHLYGEYVRAIRSKNASKMASMTSLSSGEPWESK